MNPQHTVPALVDGDLILNESRPIATYLCAKYGKDDKLYPKDPATRAKVDCALYFDMGTFYKAAMNDIAVSTLWFHVSLETNLNYLFLRFLKAHNFLNKGRIV